MKSMCVTFSGPIPGTVRDWNFDKPNDELADKLKVPRGTKRDFKSHRELPEETLIHLDIEEELRRLMEGV